MTLVAKGLAALIAGALMMAAAAVQMPSVAGGGDNECWEIRRSEKRFKNKINHERADESIAKLHLDPELSKVARRHTKEMIEAGKGLFHSTSVQLDKRVTTWTMLGENVGVGGTVGSLHKAFMDSPPHAANVLRPDYVRIGVGAKRDDDDRLWVTMVFQAGSNPDTTLPMPKCG